MKKYFTLFFAMLFSMVAMAEETVFYTMTTPKAAGNNAYATYYNVTINDMSWNAPGNQSFDGYWRIGGKSLDKVDRKITANDAMGSAISKVVLNHKGVSNANLTINSIKLAVATDKNFNNIVETISKSLSDNSVTFEPTATEWPTGAYYRLTINCTNSKTSNYGLDITSLVFFTDEGEGGGSTVTVPTPTFSVAAGTYTENQTVKVKNYVGDYIYAYTLDGSTPAFNSDLDVTNGEEYDDAAGITITESCTLKIVATDVDGNLSSVASATYTINKPVTFASLEELVAADLADGSMVTVSFSDVEIKSIFVTTQGYRNGVYFDIQKGGKDIEIYYKNVPESWVAGGTLSGTMTCPWKLYSGTWELAPADGSWDWNNLTYTAPANAKETATISASEAKKNLTVGDDDEYTVSYDGDGVLEITSSNEAVAEAIIVGNEVIVSALAAGTTTITISAPATDNYYAAEYKYTLTVEKAPAVAELPFSFDGGKNAIANTDGMSQNGLGTDYSNSPKLKFDGTNDELVINFAGQAGVLKYDIKGNSFSGGTFEVKESANGTDYTTIKTYTDELSTSSVLSEVCSLAADTRYVKFLYTNKDKGNVGLGDIEIFAGYARDVESGSYGTICLPYAVTAPEGATFYSVKNITAGEVNLTEESSLEAGKPYIFLAAADAVVCEYTGDAVAEPVADTYLTGVFVETAAPAGSYVLQNQDGVVGFYKVGSVVPTVGAYRAYLTVESNARVLTFGEETAISNVEVSNSANAAIYNMAGQRVSKAQKGIFIINGKKVVK